MTRKRREATAQGKTRHGGKQEKMTLDKTRQEKLCPQPISLSLAANVVGRVLNPTQPSGHATDEWQRSCDGGHCASTTTPARDFAQNTKRERRKNVSVTYPPQFQNFVLVGSIFDNFRCEKIHTLFYIKM
jgi:hypothetical protein